MQGDSIQSDGGQDVWRFILSRFKPNGPSGSHSVRRREPFDPLHCSFCGPAGPNVLYMWVKDSVGLCVCDGVNSIHRQVSNKRKEKKKLNCSVNAEC